LAAWAAVAAAALAPDSSASAAAPTGASLLAFGPAAANVFDEHPKGMGFVEYRYTTGRLRPGPWLALEMTDRDLLVGFGVFLDVPLGARWLFTPSLGAALYYERDGLGLGGPIEFRSTAELTYAVGRWRVGGSIGHFSNAHLAETNPGTEVLKLVWIAPLSRAMRPAVPAGPTPP
jgi:lipid A 3-O-deacylase